MANVPRAGPRSAAEAPAGVAKADVERNLAGLDDEELLRIVAIDAESYESFAVEFAREELTRRGRAKQTVAAYEAVRGERPPKSAYEYATWPTLRRRWAAWLLATVLGSAVGYAALRTTMPERVAPDLNGVVLMSLLGGMLGLAVGVAQWLVLRNRCSNSGWWVLATTVGLAVSVALDFGVGFEVGLTGAPTARWFFRAGVCLLPVGILQWLVLRRHVRLAALWVLASSLGWCLAMGMEVAGQLGALRISSSEVSRSVGWLIGAAMNGAVTGGAFVWLVPVHGKRVGPDMAKPESRFSFGTIIALILPVGCMVFVFVATRHDVVVVENSAWAELDKVRAAIRDKVQTIRNRRGDSIFPVNRLELTLQNMADSADAILRRYEDDTRTLEQTDHILNVAIESVARAPNMTVVNRQLQSLYNEMRRFERSGAGRWGRLIMPPEDQ